MPNLANSVCAECNTVINRTYPGLKCQGLCHKYYHCKCGNIRSEIYKLLSSDTSNKAGVTWRCPNCTSALENPSGFEDCESTPTSYESDTSDAVSLRDVLREIKKLSSELSDFKAAHLQLQNSVKECLAKVGMIEANATRLAVDNDSLRTQLRLADQKIDQLDQHSRMQNIEIYGIPERREENLVQLVLKISAAAKYPLRVEDVDACHRVRPRTPQQTGRPSSSSPFPPRTIVLRLSSRRIKEDLLAAIRTSKPTTEVISATNIKRIYFNEHLSPRNKNLLFQTRAAAKLANFQFVWVRDAKIFTRKNTTSHLLQIRSPEDITKISLTNSQQPRDNTNSAE